MPSLQQVTSDLVAWATEEPRTRVPRLQVANHLVGLDLSPYQVPDPNSGERQYRSVGTDPMPAHLGDWIEERTRQVRSPCREAGDEGTAYVIPKWLLRLRGSREIAPWPGLRTRIRPGHVAKTEVQNPFTSRLIPRVALHEIILRRQIANARRRKRLRAKAGWLLTCLNEALGYDPVRPTWLLKIIENPEEFEQWALSGVWNPFVEEFDRPASLLLRTDCPSLRDQLRLEQGLDGGTHRKSFAEQQPWAAISLLNEPHAGHKLGEIYLNPANGFLAAARRLCCTPADGPCRKSINFARRLARHRHVPSLDLMLGNQRPTSRRLRSLLMEAHTQDGELLSHIRDDSTLVRRQIALANTVSSHLQDYRCVSSETAYDTAALLVRMIIRDRFVDTDRLQPDVVGDSLFALSGDTLAAYAEHRSDPTPGHPACRYSALPRSLDAGIRAFVRFVGSTRKPQLTTRQLIRFSEHCAQIQTHLFRHQQRRIPTKWPIVPQVAEACRRLASDGNALVPLASIAGLRDEGRTMRNCLAERRSHSRKLVMGDIAIVSVRVACGDRATLELRPVMEIQSGEGMIRNWEIGEFRGPGNTAPSNACRRIVGRLTEELDAQGSIPIPETERQRQRELHELLFPSQEINRDKDVADELWHDFYLRGLPGRFSAVTPRILMVRYYECLVAKF